MSLQTASGDLEEHRSVVVVEVAHVRKSGRHPFDVTPLPHDLRVDATALGEQRGAITHEAWRVTAHERLVVLAHRDTEVVSRSEHRPSASTNLYVPRPASTVFQPWASPCTITARIGSNAAARDPR